MGVVLGAALVYYKNVRLSLISVIGSVVTIRVALFHGCHKTEALVVSLFSRSMIESIFRF